MLKDDSRKITPGDIFIALSKNTKDGHDYVEEAIKNGASKVIVEKGTYTVPTLVVEDTYSYLLDYLKENYCYLINEMNLIGITGTNGKTTTCFLIYQALNKLDNKCGYIGTLGFYMEDKVRDLPNTTPSLLDIYEMLLECYNQGYKNVVMEVSSHGLAFDRVLGIKYDYAVFTNLTKDHLDYHETMENYALSKKKLFTYLKEFGKSIVNIDDPYHKYFMLEQSNNITYGIGDSDYKIADYYFKDVNNIKITGRVNEEFTMNLIGKYNVYNMTVAIIILCEMGYDVKVIKNVVKSLLPPKGRMDIINHKTNKIIIDYAHTPDAVLNILNAVNEMTNNNIYTVVGCGGNRDKTKRPIMGEIATNLSTKVIFTSDNPRFEEPMDILDDITRDLKNTNYEIEVNRKKAIEKGIQLLSEFDILLVLGKGHETYQVIKGEKVFFDDKLIVQEVIGDD